MSPYSNAYCSLVHASCEYCSALPKINASSYVIQFIHFSLERVFCRHRQMDEIINDWEKCSSQSAELSDLNCPATGEWSQMNASFDNFLFLFGCMIWNSVSRFIFLFIILMLQTFLRFGYNFFALQCPLRSHEKRWIYKQSVYLVLTLEQYIEYSAWQNYGVSTAYDPLEIF